MATSLENIKALKSMFRSCIVNPLKLVSMIFLFSLLTMSACKKNKLERSSLEKLQGRWTLNSWERVIEKASVPKSTRVKYGKPGEHIHFHISGNANCTVKALKEVTLLYTLDDDYRLTLLYPSGQQLVFSIKDLTEDRLILYKKEILNANAQAEDIFILTK